MPYATATCLTNEPVAAVAQRARLYYNSIAIFLSMYNFLAIY